MSWLVQSRLVNAPFADPGLYLDFRFASRALLFDAGEIASLGSREILRISDVFISHRHMDHFVGFDRLLRLFLHRPQVLRLVGPPDFVAGIEAKFGAYSWNLLDASSPDFVLMAAEFDGERLGSWTVFRARDAFRARGGPSSDLPTGAVLAEDGFRIECTMLDHGMPCLAFALQERLRVNVRREGLERLGLPVGPWLNQAKAAVRSGAPDDTAIRIDGGATLALGLLKEAIFRVGKGQRIAYVTDAAGTADNAARIVALARDADQLYIEAPFLEADRAIADARRHLTAHQAGLLARRAGARRLTTFHYSPRYEAEPDSLRREAEAAFRSDERC